MFISYESPTNHENAGLHAELLLGRIRRPAPPRITLFAGSIAAVMIVDLAI